MIILDSLDKISSSQSPMAITIGNFDGVHLGHQKLLKVLKANSDYKTLVITFDPHPVEYFDKNKTFRKLFSSEYQNERMQEMGIDYLLRLKFDSTMANLSYDQFLNMFSKKLNLKKVVVGHDLKIGKDRKGDFEAIHRWSQNQKIDFQMIEPLSIDGQIVSSTFIKSLVEDKRFADVPKYLGRNYSIDGVIIHGDKRGRLIGFPTANVVCLGTLYLPHFGVYQTQTVWNKKRFQSITNVGKTPTFKTDDLIKVETHLFNFNQEIYGEKISVEFIKFVRSEKKFSGIEEIKQQIALDIASIGQGKGE